MTTWNCCWELWRHGPTNAPCTSTASLWSASCSRSQATPKALPIRTSSLRRLIRRCCWSRSLPRALTVCCTTSFYCWPVICPLVVLFLFPNPRDLHVVALYTVVNVGLEIRALGTLDNKFSPPVWVGSSLAETLERLLRAFKWPERKRVINTCIALWSLLWFFSKTLEKCLCSISLPFPFVMLPIFQFHLFNEFSVFLYTRMMFLV